MENYGCELSHTADGLEFRITKAFLDWLIQESGYTSPSTGITIVHNPTQTLCTFDEKELRLTLINIIHGQNHLKKVMGSYEQDLIPYAIKDMQESFLASLPVYKFWPVRLETGLKINASLKIWDLMLMGFFAKIHFAETSSFTSHHLFLNPSNSIVPFKSTESLVMMLAFIQYINVQLNALCGDQ